MTPAQRARIAALSRWSAEDPKATAERAQAGFRASFERKVDPEGQLSDAERLRRAECAYRAHMQRLALRSAAARRARRGSSA